MRSNCAAASRPVASAKGERIPLELLFTSTTPKRYQLNMAAYDRSGRMGYEHFHLVPDTGTRDPLKGYFGTAGAWLGGGLTSFRFLSTRPEVIHLDLNEWIAIDRVGDYRLMVVSSRVSDARAGESVANRPLESNEIALRIVPAEPEWQRAELARIRTILDAAKPSAPANHERSEALAALRFLGSADSVRELARRLHGGPDEWPCAAGLIGSPHRDAGLEEMRKLLAAPDFPVTYRFLRTMAILTLDLEDRPERIQQRLKENQTHIAVELAGELSHKRGTALAVSTATALDGLGESAPPASRQALVRRLMESFSTLPPEQQLTWVQYRWKSVEDPAWLPILRTLATRYQDFPELRAMPAYESLGVSGAALKRWYELDSDGARSAVLTEITRPKPRYGADVLGLLPDETLPEAEVPLARHLAEANNYEIEAHIASLLDRYATSAVVGLVLPKLDDQLGTWACAPQNALLAFVLKADPVTARPRIEQAIAARGEGKNACRHSVLGVLGAAHPGPLLEELAIHSLEDADPEVAIDAARYLGQYGSEASQEALWRRYEAWSREWKGRESELRVVFGELNPNVWQANLGQELARALGAGIGWLFGEKELHRIVELAVGSNIRQQAEQQLNAWKARPLSVTGIPFNPPKFSVAQYDQLTRAQLQQKLSQFPHGTELRWTLSGNPPDESRTFEELAAWASAHGLKLTRSTP